MIIIVPEEQLEQVYRSKDEEPYSSSFILLFKKDPIGNFHYIVSREPFLTNLVDLDRVAEVMYG